MPYGGKCEFCQRDVDASYAAYPVTGWEVTRAGGGANRILGRERLPGRIAHEECVRRSLRESPGQTALV